MQCNALQCAAQGGTPATHRAARNLAASRGQDSHCRNKHNAMRNKRAARFIRNHGANAGGNSTRVARPPAPTLRSLKCDDVVLRWQAQLCGAVRMLCRCCSRRQPLPCTLPATHK